MTESNPSDGETNSLLRVPACDSCRTRKVKCDRKVPCSNCTLSRVPCRTTKRNPEKRQRILVSGRYEREIENVNDRLASLERILETFVDRHKSSPQQQGPSSTDSSSRPETLSTPRDSQLMYRGLDYEGGSSFSAHSKHITQAIENSLSSSPNSTSASLRDVSAAVATLRTFLNEKQTFETSVAPSERTLQDSVHYPELSNLPLAPMAAVLGMLRWAKANPQKYFHDMPTITLPYITTLCQRLYFPTEEYTIATFITVHVVLFNVFRALKPDDAQAQNLAPAERQEITAICLKNAEVALRNLRLYMEPTYENVEALMMGATLALDLCQPSFGWTLLSAAARLAQDAGYHRLPPFAVAPDATPKRLLFWFVFCMERMMALNFGRMPALQLCDIEADPPIYPDEIDGLWGKMYASWVDYAGLQGEIYEQLYSSAAQRETTETKAHRARALAARLVKIKAKFDLDLDNEMQQSDDIAEDLLSIKIVMNSTLTLVYRMIPPPPAGRPHHALKFCDQAIQTAREAMRMHNDAWVVLRHRTNDEWRLFLHWTLVWCPFVPYIVLFGNVIADGNTEDLKLLERCVETLRGEAESSVSVSKLYRACRIFYQIAQLFLNSRKEDSTASNTTQLQQQQQHKQQQQPSHSYTQPGHMPRQLPPQSVMADSSPMLNDIMLNDTVVPDLPLSQQDWDGMLDQWDLGLGAGNAREMSAFFEPYLTGPGPGTTFMGNTPMGNQGPFG